ncbi:MAG TPA: hypothetical protein VMZ26_16535 [Pyrinomonadaceae bacterium]|nr:hypothetical protein [Pyrinomonadaceae bacterium]
MAPSGYGQDLHQPILVEEHGSIPCDDSLARLDAFYADLYNNPGSSGFISIANAPEKRRDGVFRADWIPKYTRFRGFDLSRIKIVRTLNDGDLRVSFWRIPPGGIEPAVKVDESYELPRIMNPFLFGWEDEIGDPICPPVDHTKIFARFLKANPSARANLVSRAKSLKTASRNAAHVVVKLVRTYRIPRSRIRIFLRHRELNPMASSLPITELWFLP